MYLTFVLYTECVPTINQDVDKEARKIDFQDFTLYEILLKQVYRDSISVNEGIALRF